MSVNGGQGLSSATTYQAIVIALVAAGIISIGVMSVCYRRRRRDEWERTVRAGLERARFRRGFGEGGGGDGFGEDLGEKPILWDVDIGGKGEEWVPIRMGMDNPDFGKKPSSLAPQPTGPTSDATIPSPTPKTTQVDMTILIAMPYQPRPASSNGAPLSRSSSLASIDLKDSFTLDDLPHYHYTPTRQEVDEEEIPHLELGTTSIPLIIGSEAEMGEMEQLRLGRTGSRAVGSRRTD